MGALAALAALAGGDVRYLPGGRILNRLGGSGIEYQSLGYFGRCTN